MLTSTFNLPFTALFLSAVDAQGSTATVRSTVSITFPPSRPSTAVTVPGDFVGLGFETAFLNDYANEFSENLVSSVAARMSESPIIRIGGTSGDQVMFDPNQEASRLCLSGGCPNGSSAFFILGPSYFEGFKRFQNARMSFQAPLGPNPVNISNTLDYVRRAYNAVGSDRLAAIAIGNEVDVYESTASAYVAGAIEVEHNITTALKLQGIDATVFEVLDTSSGAVDKQTPFTLAQAFEAGLNENNQTKSAAEHYYQIDGTDTFQDNLQSQLMNHTFIQQKFANHAKSISYVKANTKLPYILSETGSSLFGNISFAGSFGACLWAVDFQLYSMSMGVARVDGSQRPVTAHSLWVPTATTLSGPQVQAPYYALQFIADFIGKTTAARGVVNYDLQSDFMSAYAVYNGTDLARMALVNLHEWNATSGIHRPTEVFSLKVPAGVTSVLVESLSADVGAEALGFDVTPGQNITWAGRQWSYKVDNGRGHRSGKRSTTVKVVDGTATITVLDSEAVIVYVLSGHGDLTCR